MPLAEELLKRVCADPDDVDARRVYADFLQDQGDPRGTYVAQHCALSELDVLSPEYPALLASVRRLEARTTPSWLGELLRRSRLDPGDAPRTALDEHRNAVFRHGFLHRIAMTPEAIAADWAFLRAREPVQGIELVVGEHLPDVYHALTEPRAFRTLKISPNGWFFVQSVGDVLRWGMPELRELDLSKCDLGASGAEMLLGLETDLPQSFEGWTPPPPLPSTLESLVLHGTKLGDAGARVLLSSSSFANLRALDLGQCSLTDPATLGALAAASLPRLARLSIAGNNALGGQLSALAGWPTLGRLEALALPQSTTAADLQALFPTPSTALRELDFSSARDLLKTPEAVFGVATSFTTLDLGTTSLGDAGLRVLLLAPACRTLLELHLNGCSLSDAAVDALVRSKLDRLVTLDLSSNKLSDAALKSLAGWPGLASITHLRLGNNRKLTAVGYSALANATQFDPVALDIGKPPEGALPALTARFGSAVRTKG